MVRGCADDEFSLEYRNVLAFSSLLGFVIGAGEIREAAKPSARPG